MAFKLLITLMFGLSFVTAQNIPISSTYKENDVFQMYQNPSSTRQAYATDMNQKPQFKDCANYKPTVKEEQMKDTFVIKVQAEDDDPEDKGGTVTYKIVARDNERANFKINNATGEITTLVAFDRDEPLRQKELYLTVIGTDNGIPPLADICTFKVIVTDINDNIPTFDQSSYSTQVAEDLKKDSEVLRIFAYDIDDGENARLTYKLDTNKMPSFAKYFRLDENTGVIYLQEELRSTLNNVFKANVIVSDNGEPNHSQTAEIQIRVVGSGKKTPSIRIEPTSLTLQENYTDFASPLVKVVVDSNSDQEDVFFELVKGKTAQTNKGDNFRLIPSDENDYTAYIKLINHLDYETVTDYVLTVRVQNKDLMDSTINIPVTVQDVNDETPSFIDVYRGSIVENDKPGAQAIQIRAVDKDGTSPNNLVFYQLLNYQDLFEIDRISGIIRSKVQFDRESNQLYHVRVQAEDGAPSAIVPGGKPNRAVQDFQISIEDRNDNVPHFTQSLYQFSNISEKSNKAAIAGAVQAIDKDTSSYITYSIINGNTDNAFSIESTTGRVKVNGKLDYEKQEDYNLTVMAFDGIFNDTATVHITILNENDELPVFDDHLKEISLQEERTYNNCIVSVTAYDPDIKDRNADQHIVYDIQQQMREFLSVDKSGCVRVIKELDRDKPYGSPTRQVFIYAYDNDGLEGGLHAGTEIQINLEDINDNAPFLNVTEIVWFENQDPNHIGSLSADDYDGPNNGPPFTYELVDNTQDFTLIEDQLHAQRTFDREQQKYYDLRIKITDSGSPQQSGISTLRVIIGDVNDNQAKDGESEIFVNHFQEIVGDIEIGRVYVDDPDDWDLNDKTFEAIAPNEHFYLSRTNNGMIMMQPSVVGGKYVLNFRVTERSQFFDEHEVRATVTVTVKEIPRDAVIKSGSIRMKGITAEQFVEKNGAGVSKKDILQQSLAKWFNTSIDNVDVITIMTSNNSFVDVRFSAHGSPYYPPVKLNDKIVENRERLEKTLGMEFVMIDIDECLSESVCDKGQSCINELEIANTPAVVFTNKTSFVGIRAGVKPSCQSEWNGEECLRNNLGEEEMCTCPPGLEGPRCESLSVGFNENHGWAMYPTFYAWNEMEIFINMLPLVENGLIFYVGPPTPSDAHLHKEFMFLELQQGKLVLKFNLGAASYDVISKKLLKIGESHKVRIKKSTDYLEMEVDDCKSQCISMVNFKGDSVLNVNGPLQVGGMKYKFGMEDAKMIWGHNPPTTEQFVGCIQNFSINGYFYKLGKPAVSYNYFPDCNYGVLAAVSLGIDSNFLVAILVCIALLIILLLAVVVHRRKQDNFNEKENDDTRANIINYEVEGGGECDTNYDLSVFRPAPLDEKLPLNKDQDPNISDFLENKKDNCDKNPENLPFDDVRHYAYEGDGNSTGSLSSLASCTDEGDLKFHYLSNFGPRFKKLADMYGEDASDDDSHDGGEESWC